MGLKDELVSANDPEIKNDEAEEEEEEDLVDPMDGIKEQCQQTPKCEQLKEILQQCTDRVENGGSERCDIELMDFVHCVDHCAADKIFKYLK